MARFQGLARTVIVALVLGPALALLPAAALERSSEGDLRLTAVPLALAVSDPFLWRCARNSAAAAAAVAFGSLVIGVSLAGMAGRWRFPGRGPLWTLVCTTMAVPPAVAAIGLRGLLFAPGDGGDLDSLRWIALIWSGLVWGVPMVALVARSALARIEPTWEDASRGSGARRRAIWWSGLWPLVRPSASRTSSAIFAWTLLEPGAPIVLGLRPTLAFQVVESAVEAQPGAGSRAAVLALMGLGLAVIGGVLIRWWGGRAWPLPPAGLEARAEPAGWFRSLPMVLGMTGWGVFALVPAVGLIATVLSQPPGREPVGATSLFAVWLHDPDLPRVLVVSLMLGLLVALINGALARLVAGRPGTSTGMGRTLVQASRLVPPLAIGVGVLMIPALFEAMADLMARGRGMSQGLAGGLRWLAQGLDPYRVPGVALVWAVAAVRLPLMVRAAGIGARRYRSTAIEAAQTLGATPRRALRTTWMALVRPAWVGAWVLTAVLAASNIAPALVLVPTSEARPIGPTLLLRVDDPEEGLRRASGLACAMVVLNLVALGLASRRSAGPLSRLVGHTPL